MNKLKCYIILNLKKKLLKKYIRNAVVSVIYFKYIFLFWGTLSVYFILLPKSAVCTLYCYYVSNCVLYKEKLN